QLPANVALKVDRIKPADNTSVGANEPDLAAIGGPGEAEYAPDAAADRPASALAGNHIDLAAEVPQGRTILKSDRVAVGGDVRPGNSSGGFVKFLSNRVLQNLPARHGAHNRKLRSIR